ncbi:MAG: glycine zipper domain-containing protein [Sedimentisphaerales bacterium]|nr:glycine zipper domain-containing protein [Sedimentisphaerales bacterium]
MFRNVVTVALVVVAGVGLVFVAGCETKAQTGAGIGTLGGAGLGAIIGHQSGNAGVGALIGGAAGAAGGYLIGNEGDKKDTQREMQSARDEANTTVVNITNSNGSITPVILRRSGNMWIGPKGEQYMSIPTVEQLKPVYGF